MKCLFIRESFINEEPTTQVYPAKGVKKRQNFENSKMLQNCFYKCLVSCRYVLKVFCNDLKYIMLYFKCSTSPSGGNLVDGLPPAPVLTR